MKTYNRISNGAIFEIIKLALIAGCLLGTLLAYKAQSADVYTAANDTLSIPQVIDGETIYTGVVIRLEEFSVTAVGGGAPAGSQDTYNSLNQILTIPSVSVGTRGYTNVTVHLISFQLLAIGGHEALPRAPTMILTASPAQVAPGARLPSPGLRPVRHIVTALQAGLRPESHCLPDTSLPAR